jgi:nucleoside-diphosphate-sugar epimerase
MRIFFTGGSGKAGRHVIPHLIAQGHWVTNFDRVPLNLPGVHNLTGDLMQAGDVWSALSRPADFADLEGATPPPSYDAVVHFAAVPRVMLRSDRETFAVNTQTTYNVLEAALGLGIGKVIFASSETTYGICFAQGERRPVYLPVDEDHPTVPEDSYAMSKVVNEATARSFQARSGADIYGLRINNVIEPHEYDALVPAAAEDPSIRRRNIFAYIDAVDLGRMVACCLRTDGLGFEMFNVANPDSSVDLPTAELVARFYHGIDVRRALTGRETLYAIDKARRLVGFAPRASWAPGGDRNGAAAAP